MMASNRINSRIIAGKDVAGRCRLARPSPVKLASRNKSILPALRPCFHSFMLDVKSASLMSQKKYILERYRYRCLLLVVLLVYPRIVDAKYYGSQRNVQDAFVSQPPDPV